MPLAPPAIYSILMANRTLGANAFNGDAYMKLCRGTAEGIAAWAIGQPQNVALTGAAVGQAGAGNIIPTTTRLVVPPTVPVMLSALQGAGLNGPLAFSLATAMSGGVSEAFSTLAMYTGPSSSVGIGEDISKVTTANPATLIAILQGTLAGAEVAGLAMPMMAVGLGNGIAGLVALGIGSGQVSGGITIPPTPAAGTTGSSTLL